MTPCWLSSKGGFNLPAVEVDRFSSCYPPRVQRKSVLQPAIRASYRQHVLAQKSFQLAPKPFLISRIDYNPSVIRISQKQTLARREVKNKNH